MVWYYYSHLKTIIMRTLLIATMDVSTSNNAVSDGSLARVVKSTMDRIQPEACYFTSFDGCRSCFMVFDLKDTSDIPSIAEPLFQSMNAKIEFRPVMNAEDLMKGLEKL
jgi:hypothetical protein